MAKATAAARAMAAMGDDDGNGGVALRPLNRRQSADLASLQRSRRPKIGTLALRANCWRPPLPAVSSCARANWRRRRACLRAAGRPAPLAGAGV